MSRSFFVRARGAVLAAGCILALSGCVTEDYMGFGPKHLRQLSPQTLALIEGKGMAKDSPILLRLFKEESELEIWKQTKQGRYELFKTYPICRWSGELGPKIREGDRQAPEGFYDITPELMNPRSSYYLAFNLGYPNEFDRAYGRTGAHLMVHGDCSSRGCYAMTDEQILEIFALARESFDGGQLAFQVQAYPFRMTANNLARHRKNPHLAFWRVLKEGSDHFEQTKLQPKVDVCDKRYVFNAHLIDPSKPFEAQRPCPAYEVPQEIAVAVASKKETDERMFTMLARLGVSTAPIVTGRDGGTNPTFAAGLPGSDDRFVAARPAPGSLPAHTASSGRTMVAGVPLPPADPRQRNAGAVSFASPPSEGFSLGRVSGSGGAERSEAGFQPTARAVPTPTAAPARTQATRPVIPVTRPVQAAGTAPSRSAPAEQPAQEKPAGPPPMPGATPILSTGGFSYN